MHSHHYKTSLQWTGNTGSGTSNYRSYTRDFTIQAGSKATIHGSSDPAFRGDAARYNPEEMLVASLSSCHMLWYLHLCAEAGVVVIDYSDNAEGTMEETAGGSGKFTGVTLRPLVKVQDRSMLQKAAALHGPASKMCFIANSCNFPVHHEPTIEIA